MYRHEFIDGKGTRVLGLMSEEIRQNTPENPRHSNLIESHYAMTIDRLEGSFEYHHQLLPSLRNQNLLYLAAHANLSRNTDWYLFDHPKEEQGWELSSLLQQEVRNTPRALDCALILTCAPSSPENLCVPIPTLLPRTKIGPQMDWDGKWYLKRTY